MTLVLAVVMIVFCEFAPKIFAAVHAERGCTRLGIYLSGAAMDHLAACLGDQPQPRKWLLGLFGVHRGARLTQALSTDELRTVVAESSTLVPPRHRQMLLSILDLERVRSMTS